MRKIFIIVLAGILWSCDGDPIEAGVVTTIEGRIYDRQNELPFENLKIKVAEYKTHQKSIYMHTEFIQWIDSTYTDQNGDYLLEFETSGRGDLYQFHVESRPNMWDYNNGTFDIPYIGKNSNIDLGLLHLFPVKLVIEMNDIGHLPVTVNPRFYQDVEDINTGSGTVERTIFADKNSDNTVYFSRRLTPNDYEGYTAVIPATHTTELANYNLTLNNSDFVKRE
ncbi:hypothetical protein OQ279_08480 [Salinimicrobium sp. MT39]|uniref:Uncharacterized protein n=1 Tax=Salinimicrobium profundisediminis TaxID=2994553 RepID=A0A9X3I0T6_9FLAO|nr:hypothetical protein [Salinimicrobium profundisediminis]MCX2838191.1 hypothetical protein [Salinimicrobium profundisediminis]